MFKEDGQEYAQVVKMLGNGRLEAYCFDGVTRLCHIRGKLRKKVNFIFLKDLTIIHVRMRVSWVAVPFLNSLIPRLPDFMCTEGIGEPWDEADYPNG